MFRFGIKSGVFRKRVQMSDAAKQTILVVEDYKDSLEMIRFLLEDLGYRILEAQNGKQALELASRQTPDLVLTDFNLPDVDGTTLIKRLRKLSAKMSRVPVIMLTARDPDEVYEMARAAGCSAFLTKPVSFVVLEKTINALLAETKELNESSVNGVSH